MFDDEEEYPPNNGPCRLCLNVNVDLLKPENPNDLNMIQLCIPEVDLSFTDEPSVCDDCLDELKQMYIFKVKCLQSEEKLRCYTENSNPDSVNLKDVVECITNNVPQAQTENSDVCRCCLLISEDCTPIEEESNMFLLNMLNICIPELDISLSANPVLCDDCTFSLKQYYLFKTTCLQTEDEIRTFKTSEKFLKRKEYYVNLYEVIRTKNHSLNLESLEHINIERGILEGEKIKIKLEQEALSVDGVKDVRKETIKESECTNSDTDTKNEIFKVKLERGEHEANHELGNVEEWCLVKKFKCDGEVSTNSSELYDESGIGIKKEIADLLEPEIAIKSEREIPEYYHPECSVIENHHRPVNLHQSKNSEQTTETTDPELGILPPRLQLLTQQPINPPITEEVKWYTCEVCSYQTKWKQHLVRHRQIHSSEEAESNKLYKCNTCGYVTKYKHSLTRHNTVEHGDYFKCDMCNYETKWKRCYNQHLLSHKGGAIWYDCELCEYKSKYKYHIKRHMQKHDK